MKRILIVILFSLVSSFSHAASENVYLMCQEIVTENQMPEWMSTKKDYEKGTYLTTSLAAIYIKKKSTKIEVFRPVEDGMWKDEGLNKKIFARTASGERKKLKAIIKDNTYTYKIVEVSGPFETIDRYKFIRDNANWSVKIKVLFKVTSKDNPTHIEWLAEGKCKIIDKKIFNIKRKKGINSQDFEF